MEPNNTTTELMTQTEWAKTQGFSPQYVNKLVKKGIVKLVGKKVDPIQANEAYALYRNTDQPERRKRSESDSERVKQIDIEIKEAKLKQEKLQAIKLEREEKIATGQYIDKKEAYSKFYKFIRKFRDNMKTIANRVSAMVAITDDQNEVHNIINKEVNIVLKELHDERYNK